jgi:hypothetical protein
MVPARATRPWYQGPADPGPLVPRRTTSAATRADRGGAGGSGAGLWYWTRWDPSTIMERPASGTGPGDSGPPGRTRDGIRRTIIRGPDMSNRTIPRLVGALLAGLLGLALVAPMAALAADGPGPVDAPPTDAQPTDAQPTDAQPTEVIDDGIDGEVVYDPYFVSPEPDATPETAPVAAVRGGTGRPRLTPPPTDTAGIVPDHAGGSGVPLLLVALAALSFTVPVLGRAPGVRHR